MYCSQKTDRQVKANVRQQMYILLSTLQTVKADTKYSRLCLVQPPLWQILFLVWKRFFSWPHVLLVVMENSSVHPQIQKIFAYSEQILVHWGMSLLVYIKGCKEQTFRTDVNQTTLCLLQTAKSSLGNNALAFQILLSFHFKKKKSENTYICMLKTTVLLRHADMFVNMHRWLTDKL